MRELTLGSRYFWRGLRLLRRPELRLFVLLPLLLNVLVFTALIALSLDVFGGWIEQLMGWLPDWDWLALLRWILWPLMVMLLLVAVMYSFSVVANVIAAPFNGLLAERVEALLTGTEPEAGGLTAALRDAPRAIGKELLKLLYYLPRALLVALLSLIFLFVFPPVSTALWFLLGAWMMALEYCDYPMDNHKFSLTEVRQRIATWRWSSLGFGGTVMLGTMVPVFNFIVMPAAVCGATVYWVERLRGETTSA